MNEDKKAKEKGDDPADLLDIKLEKHKESAAKDIKNLMMQSRTLRKRPTGRPASA